MDVYLFLLCTGFGGSLLLCLLGLGHHHHSGGRGSHAHGGGAHQPVQTTAHHHGPAVKSVKTPHATSGGSRSAHFLLTLVSPRVIFSLLLGFGAAGVLLHPLAIYWPAWVLPSLALVLALALEWYLVQPLWRLLLGFASKPARTLDHLLLEEGRAVTNFDGTGHGLIAVELDGQVRQLLGVLTPEEHAAGWRVRKGDCLFIRAIDAQRNSCTVSHVQ